MVPSPYSFGQWHVVEIASPHRYRVTIANALRGTAKPPSFVLVGRAAAHHFIANAYS